MRIFCGLEGGASQSTLVIVDEEGHVLARDDSGPSTNHWLIGKEECLRRIAQMLEKCLEKTRVKGPVDSLGLCLSGCEERASNEEMSKQFLTLFPSLARHCFVASDTFGSLMTVSSEGGVVLIAGTGSNCLLFNSTGSEVKCGGWGHVLGDYGSAFWISNTSIKSCIENEENFSRLEMDSQPLKRVIFQYFQINDWTALLTPTYAHFSKTHFSGLCAHVAKLALDENDPLARHIFSLAGRDLARHVLAVLPRVEPSMLAREGGLRVVCIGSVFKSWKLLSQAFLSEVSHVPELTLVRLSDDASSALGAAFMGARDAFGSDAGGLKMDFSRNSQLLCHVVFGKTIF